MVWRHWHQQPPGSWLAKLESEESVRLLKKFQGEYLLQIGGTSDFTNALANHFSYRYILNTDVIAKLDELPLLYNSIDAIILIHVLESSDHPPQLLQEVYQALAPGGKLLIIGINPWSLFGVGKWFLRDKGAPWNGKFYSRAQVNSWLMGQGYTILFNKTFCFCWPQQQAPIAGVHLFCEILGQLCAPTLGSVYMIAAQKRSYYLTPVKPRWCKQDMMRGVAPTR